MPFGFPKHIYLETSAIDSWPLDLGVAAFERLLNQCRVLKIELLIPDTVVAELQKHHIAKCEERRKSLSKALREAMEYRANRPGDTDQFKEPVLLKAEEVNRQVTSVLESKKVKIIQRPDISLNVLMEMSLKMQPPFDKNGRGFRDSVILLTILDFARQCPEEPHWIIAADSDFADASITMLAKESGITLEILKSIQEATNRLEALFDDVMKKYGEYRRFLLERLLDSDRHKITAFVQQNIGFLPSNLMPGSTVYSIDGLEIKGFGNIQLGSSDSGPVKVSFEVDLELTVSYSYTVYSEPELRVGETLSAFRLLSGSITKSGQANVPKKVSVEASATGIDTAYTDLHLKSARPVEGFASSLIAKNRSSNP